ncbi:MAG: LTA synthase family protein [Eubacteriales bacterium]|nr:LTA synthase family protein [Eubacteriales bacterium]
MSKVKNFRFLRWKCKNRIGNFLLMAGIPVLALCLMECYTHVPTDLSVPIFLLNLGFYYLLYLLCTFLLGSSARGYVLATLVPMLFGLSNYYVVSFRSSPIVPWDFYSLRTAASVAENYNYLPSLRAVLVVLGFLVLMYLGSRTDVNLPLKGSVKKTGIRLGGLILSCLCVFGYVKGIETDRAVEIFGLDTTLFTPNVLYRNNGLAAGFLRNMKFLYVEKPKRYSAAAAEEIAEEYRETETAAADTTAKMKKQPNVIVIMNEAFSDLSVFGEFETDQDYLPFIHSLKENTVKGNCYVSVKGGNTANSEYEFLTGDTMAFLPAGSVPYQQYVKGAMPGVTTYLKDLGYETHAIHPYNASGWCRNQVYPYLGFEDLSFKTEFEDPVLIRNYISDHSAFEKIIEQYEAKTGPLFTFEVTMQNHGGYSKDVGGFEESIHITQLPDKSTQVRSVEKYLTLIRESDKAFEELVRYFEKEDEDTIILMFGDHQPSDYVTNPILRLLGLDRDTQEEVFFNNYIVPFVMWANFDIEEEHVDAISVNYLSTLLFEKSGIPLTGYQQYLKQLRTEIPAVTANMVMTADGTRIRYEERSKEVSDLLSSYNMLVYNHLSDTGHRVEEFYD